MEHSYNVSPQKNYTWVHISKFSWPKVMIQTQLRVHLTGQIYSLKTVILLYHDLTACMLNIVSVCRWRGPKFHSTWRHWSLQICSRRRPARIRARNVPDVLLCPMWVYVSSRRFLRVCVPVVMYMGSRWFCPHSGGCGMCDFVPIIMCVGCGMYDCLPIIVCVGCGMCDCVPVVMCMGCGMWAVVCVTVLIVMCMGSRCYCPHSGGCSMCDCASSNVYGFAVIVIRGL